MNLIRLGPEITFDRPLAPDKVGKDKLISIPPLEDIIPKRGIAEELGATVVDPIATAARWRQIAFHNEQIGRLDGPQGSDPTRNMTEEMAELYRGALARQLAALGVIEAVEQRPSEIAVEQHSSEVVAVEQRPSEIAGFKLEVAMAAA